MAESSIVRGMIQKRLDLSDSDSSVILLVATSTSATLFPRCQGVRAKNKKGSRIEIPTDHDLSLIVNEMPIRPEFAPSFASPIVRSILAFSPISSFACSRTLQKSRKFTSRGIGPTSFAYRSHQEPGEVHPADLMPSPFSISSALPTRPSNLFHMRSITLPFGLLLHAFHLFSTIFPSAHLEPFALYTFLY